jgi:hypothetical protein
MRTFVRGRLWSSRIAPWMFASGKRPLSTHAIVLALLLTALFPYWNGRIDGREITKDARQNLASAFNVANHGVFSATDPTLEITPTREREPLAPVVVAGFIKILEAFKGPLEYQTLRSGHGARWVKLSNLLWCVIISIGIYAAVNILTGSLLFAVAATVFSAQYIAVNRLLTEAPAQGFLLLLSIFSVLMIRSPRPAYFCAAGLSLGALVLTKAAFLYVGIALFLALAAWLALDKINGRLQRNSIIGFFIFALSATALIAPWSARNYYHFGSPSLAERGGAVLYIRALKNEMTWLEYAGGFYAWAPYTWAKVLLGETLGFTKGDLEKGNRLQRLNRSIPGDREHAAAGRPDLATSYYRRALAERSRIRMEFASQGHSAPGGAADQVLERRAMQKILEKPLSHLSTVPLFLWRGGTLPLLLVSLAVAIGLSGQRRIEALAFASGSMAMVAFLGFATHYIPRYSDPAMPILVVLTTVLLYHVSVAVLRFSMRLWQENLMTPLPSTATRSTGPGPAINAPTSGH